MALPYADLILLGANGGVDTLPRVPLDSRGAGDAYSERWLQTHLFEHPQTLPVDGVDASFTPLVPICLELNTPAGPVDALYATPTGKLVLVEAKLWRNPEARRKVVGQILDYAKEVSRWSYEDLQREVSRRTRRSGNALYEMVSERFPDTDEARFVDAVSRSLRCGEFLLLICGDGIREGVAAIADFLDPYGTLHFSLGLVEVALYQAPEGALIVQPRVLAQTAIIKRNVFSFDNSRLEIAKPAEHDDNDRPERAARLRFDYEFWSAFSQELILDDVSQPSLQRGGFGFVTLSMPTGSAAWITVYVSNTNSRLGVFLTFTRGSLADLLYERLREDRGRIEQELGFDVLWQSEDDGKHRIAVTRDKPDLANATGRSEALDWLVARTNSYVNVFRPRIRRYLSEL